MRTPRYTLEDTHHGGVENVEKMTPPSWGGGSKMEKKLPPLFCVRNHESFGVFYFEPKKGFWVLTPWGLYGAEWYERS